MKDEEKETIASYHLLSVKVMAFLSQLYVCKEAHGIALEVELNKMEDLAPKTLRKVIQTTSLLLNLGIPKEVEQGQRLQVVLVVVGILTALHAQSSKAATAGELNVLLEESCVKCLNNLFYSDPKLRSVYKEHKIENQPESILEVKRFVVAMVGKISDNSLSWFYMVILLLATPSNLLGQEAGTEPKETPFEPNDLLEVIRSVIDKVCTFCDRISSLSKAVAEKKHGPQSHEPTKITVAVDIAAEDLSEDSIICKAIQNGLKLIYALGATNEKLLGAMQDDFTGELTPEDVAAILSEMSLVETRTPLLDRLGFLLMRLILAEPVVADEESEVQEAQKSLRSLQHQCFCIMMLAAKLKDKENFIGFLLSQGVVERAVELTDYYLKQFNLPAMPTAEQRKEASKTEFIRGRMERDGFLLPMMIVLNNFAEHNESAKVVIESKFFPFELGEDDYSGMTEEEAKAAKQRRHMMGSTPPNTPGARMITLMTSFDQNIKRLSAELIWMLCDCNQTQFVRRAGYGNGVHLLAIKGGMMQKMMAGQQ